MADNRRSCPSLGRLPKRETIIHTVRPLCGGPAAPTTSQDPERKLVTGIGASTERMRSVLFLQRCALVQALPSCMSPPLLDSVQTVHPELSRLPKRVINVEMR